MSKKKGILNGVFLAIVFIITVYYVFHGEDLGAIVTYLKETDIRFWVLAFLCVVLYIQCESWMVYYMVHTLGKKVKFTHCFLYSFIGYFFSCITPSASGGQPVQILYMRKDGIPISISTPVLMVTTITYKTVLLLLACFVFIFRPASLMTYLTPILGWCYLGFVLNFALVALIVLLIFKPVIIHTAISKIVSFLKKKTKLKNINGFAEKAYACVVQYHDVSDYLKSHKNVILNVFWMTAIQRFLLLAVTYMAYQSFHLSGVSMVTIVILQGMISVAVDMLPLPGGMGISERLFLTLFTPIFGQVTLAAMVLSRGLSYYTELLLSAVMTVFAHFYLGRNQK
jgi:hypothetical protein